MQMLISSKKVPNASEVLSKNFEVQRMFTVNNTEPQESNRQTNTKRVHSQGKKVEILQLCLYQLYTSWSLKVSICYFGFSQKAEIKLTLFNDPQNSHAFT